MSQIYFTWLIIAGLVVVMAVYYLGAMASIYCHYRSIGLTRKQAILCTWRVYVE